MTTDQISATKEKLPTGLTVSYLMAIPIIQRVAREHGYNLASCGSLQRDLDMVAVPWQEEASSPEVLALAICEAVEGFFSPVEAHGLPYTRPHGRLCYPIQLGSGRYIDLSVMPPSDLAQETAASRATEWQLVPIEPTPEMIAAAVGAVLPDPHPNDFELARKAARLVMLHPDTPPTCTVEGLAAAMATIIPAHRAMLAAAPAAEGMPNA